MAKRKSTPVTLEPSIIEKVQAETAAILTEKADSATPYEPVEAPAETAKSNGKVKVQKAKGTQKASDKQLEKLLEEASPLRPCICGCGKNFRPQLALSGRTTELYATPECAANALRKKGMLPAVSPEKAAAAASKAEKKAETIKQATARLVGAAKTPRTVDPDAAAHLDLKYGPWRLITEITSVYGAKQHLAKIVMECGHRMSWYNNGFPGSKKGAQEGQFLARCLGCRPKPIAGAGPSVIEDQSKGLEF